MVNKKPKKLSKKVEESHDRARGQLHKMITEHNNKVIGIGSTKIIDKHEYTLKRVETTQKNAKFLVGFLIDVGKIKDYRILKGEFGYYVWVR